MEFFHIDCCHGNPIIITRLQEVAELTVPCREIVQPIISWKTTTCCILFCPALQVLVHTFLSVCVSTGHCFHHATISQIQLQTTQTAGLALFSPWEAAEPTRRLSRWTKGERYSPAFNFLCLSISISFNCLVTVFSARQWHSYEIGHKPIKWRVKSNIRHWLPPNLQTSKKKSGKAVPNKYE